MCKFLQVLSYFIHLHKSTRTTMQPVTYPRTVFRFADITKDSVYTERHGYSCIPDKALPYTIANPIIKDEQFQQQLKTVAQMSAPVDYIRQRIPINYALSIALICQKERMPVNYYELMLWHSEFDKTVDLKSVLSELETLNSYNLLLRMDIPDLTMVGQQGYLLETTRTHYVDWLKTHGAELLSSPSIDVPCLASCFPVPIIKEILWFIAECSPQIPTPILISTIIPEWLVYMVQSYHHITRHEALNYVYIMNFVRTLYNWDRTDLMLVPIGNLLQFTLSDPELQAFHMLAAHVYPPLMTSGSPANLYWGSRCRSDTNLTSVVDLIQSVLTIPKQN